VAQDRTWNLDSARGIGLDRSRFESHPWIRHVRQASVLSAGFGVGGRRSVSFDSGNQGVQASMSEEGQGPRHDIRMRRDGRAGTWPGGRVRERTIRVPSAPGWHCLFLSDTDAAFVATCSARALSGGTAQRELLATNNCCLRRLQNYSQTTRKLFSSNFPCLGLFASCGTSGFIETGPEGP